MPPNFDTVQLAFANSGIFPLLPFSYPLDSTASFSAEAAASQHTQGLISGPVSTTAPRATLTGTAVANNDDNNTNNNNTNTNNNNNNNNDYDDDVRLPELDPAYIDEQIRKLSGSHPFTNGPTIPFPNSATSSLTWRPRSLPILKPPSRPFPITCR